MIFTNFIANYFGRLIFDLTDQKSTAKTEICTASDGDACLQQLETQVAASPATPEKLAISQTSSTNSDSTAAQSQECDGPQRAIFIGIAGGTASGKTTLCKELVKRVQIGKYEECTYIPLDNFYKGCTPKQMANID